MTVHCNAQEFQTTHLLSNENRTFFNSSFTSTSDFSIFKDTYDAQHYIFSSADLSMEQADEDKDCLTILRFYIELLGGVFLYDLLFYPIHRFLHSRKFKIQKIKQQERNRVVEIEKHCEQRMITCRKQNRKAWLSSFSYIQSLFQIMMEGEREKSHGDV